MWVKIVQIVYHLNSFTGQFGRLEAGQHFVRLHVAHEAPASEEMCGIRRITESIPVHVVNNYLPRSWTASSHCLSAMALATALVFSTQAISGRRTAWLPSSDTTQASVSGVASRTAKTASAPIRQPKTRSNAEGLPPRCTWPKTVILVSCFRFLTTTYNFWKI